MNKPKHTPGPWTVDGRYNVSATFGVQYNASNHSATAEQLSANARLIALAPELLVWTIELLNQVKRDNPDKMSGIIEHVEKLISRATGGAE